MGSQLKGVLVFLAAVLVISFFWIFQDWNFRSSTRPRPRPRPPSLPIPFPLGCSTRRDVTSCRPNPAYAMCRKANVSMDPFYQVTGPGILTGILLVVVFNNPRYELVPLLEFMYRRHFDHILYCGDNSTQYWEPFHKTFPAPLDYVEVHFHGGEWGYKCMIEAIKRNYSVQGYIHMSDDVLLNLWNFRQLPRNVPWFYEKVKKAKWNQSWVPDIWKNKGWWPWTSHKGRGPLRKTWSRLHEMAANGSKEERKRAGNFLKRLAKASGSKENVYYYASDMWYLPASKGQEFLHIMEVFDMDLNYLEIAIPTVLHGLGLPVKLISGTYLWYGERRNFTQYYSSSKMFFHPFKLAQYVYFSNGPAFFCKRFYPLLQRDLLSWQSV